MENKKLFSPLKSIRLKCLDCMCGSATNVKICPSNGVESTFCTLYPYRFGKRPEGARKRNLTEDQRQKLRENLIKARQARKAPTEPV